MVMPRWLARFNRRVLNPRNVEQRTWPVLRHVGRAKQAQLVVVAQHAGRHPALLGKRANGQHKLCS